MKYLPAVLLIVLSSSLFFFPLILSIDSVAGFLTYKGTVRTGVFNVVSEVSAANLNVDESTFVAWWSPGQWVFPGYLSRFTGISLGNASIVITILGSVLGLVGFYRLFRHFQFSREVALVSITAIIASYNFFYGFIIYQGGEVLSFAFFPWFLYFAARVRAPTPGQLAWLSVFFLLCFIAKTTLIVYCFLALFYKAARGARQYYIRDGRLNSAVILQAAYLVPGIVISSLLYFAYFSRGETPTIMTGFNPDLHGLLVPLSSPLTSILSIQQVLAAIGQLHLPVASSVLTYFVVFLIFLYLMHRIRRCSDINSDFKWLFLILYAGVSIFFIFSYLSGTDVDRSSRHFKFLGFMVVPALITLVQNRARGFLRAATLIVAALGMAAFAVLKQGWIGDRYQSVNNFYRNYDNKQNVDSMDKGSYDALMKIVEQNPSSSIVFWAEANADLLIDVPYRDIFPWNDQGRRYFGKGPPVIVCITRAKLERQPAFLKEKFPGCSSFHQIGETKTYLFYKSED